LASACRTDNTINIKMPFQFASGEDVFGDMYSKMSSGKLKHFNVDILELKADFTGEEDSITHLSIGHTERAMIVTKPSTKTPKKRKGKKRNAKKDEECKVDELARMLEEVLESGGILSAECLDRIQSLDAPEHDLSANDLLDQADRQAVDDAVQREEKIAESALSQGKVNGVLVQNSAMTLNTDAGAHEVVDTLVQEATLNSIAFPRSVEDHVATSLGLWHEALSRNMLILQASRDAISHKPIAQHGELALFANGQSVRFVHVVAQTGHRIAGRRVRIDEHQGVVAAMNTVPEQEYTDWSVIHPAVGTIMRRIRESTSHNPCNRMRPRVHDDIYRLYQMWTLGSLVDEDLVFKFERDMQKMCFHCGSRPDSTRVCPLCLEVLHPQCAEALTDKMHDFSVTTSDVPDIFTRSPPHPHAHARTAPHTQPVGQPRRGHYSASL
jgi:hypothetical protein